MIFPGFHLFRLLIGVSIIQFATSAAAYAELRIDRDDKTINAHIRGTISEADAIKLEEISRDLEHLSLVVWLNSQGGDLSSAMRIGRLIRKYEGTTWIDLNANCYSSCALVFIAGVNRKNLGVVGLHRPYLASIPQHRQVVEKQVPLMLSSIKTYVEEMGITENFYQQMVNTKPSEVSKYGWTDYTTFIPETDPVFEEVQISYEARKYGITTAEMRQRDEDARKCHLADPSEWDRCGEAIRWGVSQRVYEQRQQRVSLQCALRDDEANILNTLPKRDRRDHPIWIWMERCARNVMLPLKLGLPVLDAFCRQYPQYDDLSDQELADALYRKFYAEKMSRQGFNAKLAITADQNSFLRELDARVPKRP